MYVVGALGKPMPHRPEAEGAVRPENSMAVGFQDAYVGPGGNPDWNPHTKNGLPWSVVNRGSPLCDSLESESLLVEDLLHQVGGGLGECELAEARVDGGEVGVDDLVEGVVLHGVSFRTAACLLALVFFCVARLVASLFSCLCIFCCFSVVPSL